MGANIASNKIHTNLGKLNKVVKGLDYVINFFAVEGGIVSKFNGLSRGNGHIQ